MIWVFFSTCTLYLFSLCYCTAVLGVQVQTGEHSSIQDAQATVRLYTMVRTQWEAAIQEKHAGAHRTVKKKKTELNNKSANLTGIQQELTRTGTRQYVDSDSD